MAPRTGEAFDLDEITSRREPSASLTTQFNNLDLHPPPGLLMRMPSLEPAGFDVETRYSSVLPTEVEQWTSENVLEWLNAVGLRALSANFQTHGINGYLLLRLTEHDLDRDLEIPSNLQRVKVYRAIGNLRRTLNGRTPNDGRNRNAAPATLAATSTTTSSEHTSARSPGDSKRSLVKKQDSGKSSSLSNGTRRSDQDGVEADLSWLQFVARPARKGALAEWLLQKTKEIDGDDETETPGAQLNQYTHAALGALAVMSRAGPNDHGWSAKGGSGSKRVSLSFGASGSPSVSNGSLSGSKSLGSNNSVGSRGSGREFGVRLREALESTPGWDGECASFTAKPDVVWLQSRLADLVSDLKTNDGAAANANAQQNGGKSDDDDVFDAETLATLGSAGVGRRNPELHQSGIVEATISADISARVMEATAEASATLTLTAQDEIAEMQLALMRSQKNAMAEMHSAAAHSEAAAYEEFEAANSPFELKTASYLVENAAARQRELAVQSMQQRVMASQQTLAAEVMLRHRSDVAEQVALLEKHEEMSLEMRQMHEEAGVAVAAHENAMDTLLEHAEAMADAIKTGDAFALLETQSEIRDAAMAQRSTRKTMLAHRESLTLARDEQDEVFAVMARQRNDFDHERLAFAKATAALTVDIQTAQGEVMRRAASVMQNGASALEALPEDETVDAVAVDGGRDEIFETATKSTTTDSSNSDSMSESWEIDFASVDFAPHGVPSGDNRIGHGGFGEVFLGQLGGMNVAVKRLFNQSVTERGMREFRAEVMILSKLRHPSIVLWLGACTAAPNCTIVLEYMDHGSLSQLLHRDETPYTMITAVKWSISIARGMLYLHQHKPFPIIHCDLNSNNVLVNKEWVVKITDFGLSKVKCTSRLSRRSGIIGTVNYAAPEVIRGASSSEASDVYAFGVLVWEILTRKIPWKDLTEYQIIYKMTAATKRVTTEANATTENFLLRGADDLPAGAQEMMHACWTSQPTERPFFPQLVEECREMLRSENAKEKAKDTKGEEVYE
jgi:hypothetical protein